MSATLLVIEGLNALISLSINSLLAAQQYQALIEKARSENREITDEELAELRAANQELTDRVLGKLE